MFDVEICVVVGSGVYINGDVVWVVIGMNDSFNLILCWIDDEDEL